MHLPKIAAWTRVSASHLRSALYSTSPSSKNPVALIVGAGDSTGSAIARAFAREGLTIAAVRRNVDKLAPLVTEINGMTTQSGRPGLALPFGVDCRKEDLVAGMVDTIERDVGPIQVAVFNPGANVNFPLLETTTRVYYKVWEMACFAGFLVGREAARHMLPRGQGTIIYTGATASVRGGAGFSAFAGAKFALRALAQSMARELGPQGLHVAHVLIDGGIDTPFVRELWKEQAEEMAAKGGLLRPEDIAENYVYLHKQARSAWTHELDLRPYCEKCNHEVQNLKLVVTDSRLPAPLTGHAAVYDGLDSIYTIGGVNSTVHFNKIVPYSLESGNVEEIGTFLNLGAGAALLHGGDIIYFGGWQESDRVSTVYRISTITGEYEVVSHLPLPMADPAIAWDAESQVAYLFGGTTPDIGYLDHVLRYNASDHRIDVIARLPASRGFGTAVWDSKRRLAYVIGGLKPVDSTSNEILTFDPQTLQIKVVATWWLSLSPTATYIDQSNQLQRRSHAAYLRSLLL